MMVQSNSEEMRNSAGRTVLMLLTNCYDPDPRVRQEALALIGMGCRVRILAWDRDLKVPPYDCIEGVEVERVFLASKHGRGNLQVCFYAWLYLKMFWRAMRTSFDVIHCHDLDTLPIGFVLGKFKRKPIVYDAHESFTDMLVGSVHPGLRAGLVRLENLLIRHTDVLITVGEKLRRHFEERGAAHSVVIGNWKRPEEYSRTEEENRETRQRLGIPPNALVVTCITQLLRDRQIEELLDAIESLPNWWVIIGGKGVLEETVQVRAAKNPRVLYVGLVKANDIPSYTCASDVIYYGFDPVNPNARFSAPNKLFEALTAGRPLITGNFGEIGEVVRTARCGIVLESYTAANVRDALVRMSNSELRAEFALSAKQCGLASMNWSRGLEVLYRTYSRLLPQGSPLTKVSGDERRVGVGA
jgi:glycosyltransferase involved in cell wall biosynthesis